MKIQVISSGSHGNCTVLRDNGKRLIVDAGIKGKQLIQGLCGTYTNISGAFVTHEHGDHAKGVPDLLRAGVRVYSAYATFDELGEVKGIGSIAEHRNTVSVEAGTAVELEGYTVLPFYSYHDCREPLNYLVRCSQSGRKIAYITDTGYINSEFRDIDVLMIECNYIDDVLEANIAKYPQLEVIRNRIQGTHLSLKKVIEFVQSQDLRRCRKIILTHLSDRNSNARRMSREVQTVCAVPTVAVADGDIFEI